jgi:transposase
MRSFRNKRKRPFCLEKAACRNGKLGKQALWRKPDPEKLREGAEDCPDAFNRERAQRFGCAEEAVRLALKKLKTTRKKTLAHSEKSEEKRLLFLTIIATIAVTKHVCIDECGALREYFRECAYAAGGTGSSRT